jgi:hypothetical protein
MASETGEWNLDLQNARAVNAAMDVARLRKCATFTSPGSFRSARWSLQQKSLAQPRQCQDIFGKQVHVFAMDSGHNAILARQSAIRECD